MQILDLAANNLTCYIPLCFGHLKGMILDQYSDDQNVGLTPVGQPPMVNMFAMPPAFQEWNNEDIKHVIKRKMNLIIPEI